MDNHERLARLLLEKSYIEGDIVLTSGKKSSYYFDCKQTALHPEGGYLIGQAFLDILEKTPAVAGVAGMTLGADPLVSAVSVLSHERGRPLPGIIVRKQAKGHGTGQYLEGASNVPKGAVVALLEDVVTSGGTLVTTAERVRDAGYELGPVLAILDREEGGAARLAEAGLTLTALFTVSDLLGRR